MLAPHQAPIYIEDIVYCICTGTLQREERKQDKNEKKEREEDLRVVKKVKCEA